MLFSLRSLSYSSTKGDRRPFDSKLRSILIDGLLVCQVKSPQISNYCPLLPADDEEPCPVYPLYQASQVRTWPLISLIISTLAIRTDSVAYDDSGIYVCVPAPSSIKFNDL